MQDNSPIGQQSYTFLPWQTKQLCEEGNLCQSQVIVIPRVLELAYRKILSWCQMMFSMLRQQRQCWICRALLVVFYSFLYSCPCQVNALHLTLLPSCSAELTGSCVTAHTVLKSPVSCAALGCCPEGLPLLTGLQVNTWLAGAAEHRKLCGEGQLSRLRGVFFALWSMKISNQPLLVGTSRKDMHILFSHWAKKCRKQSTCSGQGRRIPCRDKPVRAASVWAQDWTAVSLLGRATGTW